MNIIYTKCTRPHIFFLNLWWKYIYVYVCVCDVKFWFHFIHMFVHVNFFCTRYKIIKKQKQKISTHKPSIKVFSNFVQTQNWGYKSSIHLIALSRALKQAFNPLFKNIFLLLFLEDLNLILGCTLDDGLHTNGFVKESSIH